MAPYVILTDSSCDVERDIVNSWGVDYTSLTLSFTDEPEKQYSNDDLSIKDFYAQMRAGRIAKTAAVNKEVQADFFRKYLDQGCDIVYVGCSLKQSGSVNTASVLAKKLTEEYPGSTIRCINSLRASMGEGMLAIEAAKFAENGTTADEVAEYINSRLNHLHEFCTAHTLDYLKRAGRVKASSAFFGNLLGVKPIIVADADGEQTAYKKVKGRSSSLSEIVLLLKEHIRDAENQVVCLAHADCSQDEVEEIKEIIRREIPCKEIYVGYIGQIIGASIGPDAVAVFAFGDEQTLRIGEK